MSQKVVQECDYQTKNGLDCRKRDGTGGIIIKLFTVDKDGNEHLYLTYKKDICPKHDALLQRKISSVMGDRVPAGDLEN